MQGFSSAKENLLVELKNVQANCKTITLIDESILHGRLSEQMLIFKDRLQIFISSTFDDTKIEQDFILENVFPFLREICRALDLEFDVVTMRWGINGLAGDNHMTSEICMTQLEDCKNSSIAVAYVTFQGHRYGFCPLPSKIKKDEFEHILARVQESQKFPDNIMAYLKVPFWKLDISGEPHVYMLQPVSTLPGCEACLISEEDQLRGSLHPAFKTEREKKRRAASGCWWKIFEHVQTMLREGSKDLPESVREKYVISVTHDEVNRGLLNNEKRNVQGIYFERTILDISAQLDTNDKNNNDLAGVFKDSISIGNGKRRQDDELTAHLEDMKANCRDRLPPSRVHCNEVPWVGDDALNPWEGDIATKKHKVYSKPPPEWEKYIESFGIALIEAICKSLFVEYTKPPTDALEIELISQHNTLISKLQSVGFAREEVLRTLHEYVKSSGGNKKAFVVYGISGVGKTWLMSKLVKELGESLEKEELTIFYRLLGTSQHSSDAFSLVKSLNLQYYAVQGMSVTTELEEWEQAKRWMLEEMVNWPKERGKLVVILDSIDQLSWRYMALDDIGSWIPGLKFDLPDNVKIIMSTLPEVASESGSVKPLLSRLLRFDVHTPELSPFDNDKSNRGNVMTSIETLVEAFPTHGTILPVKKSLTEKAKQVLWEIFCIDSTPLCITIAVEKILSYSSFHDLDVIGNRMKEALSMHGIPGLIEIIFADLEQKHGKHFVAAFLGLLTLSEEGLSEREAEHVLSLMDDILDFIFEWWTPPYRAISPMLVRRVIMDLGKYLVIRRSESGLRVYNWYHRQFLETARKRYLPNTTVRERLHTVLFMYFSNSIRPNLEPENRRIDAQPLVLNNTSVWSFGCIVNRRRIVEASNHLLYAGKDYFDAAINELCDFDSICAHIIAGHGFELVSQMSVLKQRIQNYSMQPVVQYYIQSRRKGSFNDLQTELTKLHHSMLEIIKNIRSIVPANITAADTSNEQHITELCFKAIRRMISTGDSHDLSQKLRTLQQRIEALSLQIMLQKVDHYMKWLKMDISTLTVSLQKYERKGVPNPDWITSCSMQPRISAVRQSPWFGRLRIKLSLSGDSDFGPLLTTLAGHRLQVNSVAFSPDGKAIASGSYDKSIKIWNSETGHVIRTLEGHSDDVTSVAFSPDGKTVASGSLDGSIKIWNAETGDLIRTLEGHRSHVNSVAFSPDGKTIASGSRCYRIKIWNSETGDLIRTLEGDSMTVLSVAYSPDGKTIASASGSLSGSSDNNIKIWNSENGDLLRILHDKVLCKDRWEANLRGEGKWYLCKIVHDRGDGSYQIKYDDGLIDVSSWEPLSDTLKAADTIVAADMIRPLIISHSDYVTSVAFSLDGKAIASGSRDCSIKIWNSETGDLIRTLDGHRRRVKSVAFSPDGKTIASGSEDQNVKIWNSETGDLIRTLDGHSHWVNAVAFSPDGKTIASGSADESIKIWNMSDMSDDVSNAINGHSGNVTSVAISPGGLKIASGSNDNSIKIWNSETGDVIRTLEGHSDDVTSVAFSSDGDTIASGSNDNSIRIWNSETGDLIRTLEGHSSFVKSVVFYPDGKTIASGSWDHSIKMWNAETGDLIRTLEGHSSYVNSVVFSPDGKTIASGSEDQSIKIWNSETGDPIRTLEGHRSYVNSVVFSPDGKTIASGSHDGIKIWNSETGHVIRTLDGHKNFGKSVAFSPDGKAIASDSGNNSIKIKIWNSETGHVIRTLEGHSDRVTSVAFSPDGKTVASGSFDGSIKIWNAETDDLAEETQDLTVIVDETAMLRAEIAKKGEELATKDKESAAIHARQTMEIANLKEALEKQSMEIEKQKVEIANLKQASP